MSMYPEGVMLAEVVKGDTALAIHAQHGVAELQELDLSRDSRLPQELRRFVFVRPVAMKLTGRFPTDRVQALVYLKEMK